METHRRHRPPRPVPSGVGERDVSVSAERRELGVLFGQGHSEPGVREGERFLSTADGVRGRVVHVRQRRPREELARQGHDGRVRVFALYAAEALVSDDAVFDDARHERGQVQDARKRFVLRPRHRTHPLLLPLRQARHGLRLQLPVLPRLPHAGRHAAMGHRSLTPKRRHRQHRRLPPHPPLQEDPQTHPRLLHLPRHGLRLLPGHPTPHAQARPQPPRLLPRPPGHLAQLERALRLPEKHPPPLPLRHGRPPQAPRPRRQPLPPPSFSPPRRTDVLARLAVVTVCWSVCLLCVTSFFPSFSSSASDSTSRSAWFSVLSFSSIHQDFLLDTPSLSAPSTACRRRSLVAVLLRCSPHDARLVRKASTLDDDTIL
mmetsp:Transcript_11585/g.34670  ORF Transcript_11585/g.34670 Transcript_11585/m.34670 type:complete len:373 (-) Transcript_11585:46-1164(-)